MLLKKLCAAAAAAVLCTAGVLPVYADAASSKMIDVVRLEPAYEPDMQTAEFLTLVPQEGVQFRITVTYHSPEREALVMYSADLTGTANRRFAMELEPGDYTFTAETARFADGGMQSYSEKITVENPDYTEGLDITRVTLMLDSAVQKDTEERQPELTASEPQTDGGTRRLEQTLTFFRYDRLRGDYNGDGTVNAADATEVLKQYNLWLAEDPLTASAGQLAACDFNGNGCPDPKDAVQILRYFNMVMAEDAGDWDVLLKPAV